MDVLIVTYHRVYNYGAALQAYATVKCFEKTGRRAKVIDYVPDKVKNYGSLRQVMYETKMFHSNRLKCLVISLLKMPSYKKKAPVFDTFLEKNVPMTERYDSQEALRDHCLEGDIYCTGSDQVWNNTYLPQFDFVYFLSFVDNVKKISFSSSFGRKDFTAGEIKQMIPFLRQYRAISVREKSGLDLLKDVDVPLKEQIIDPTLVLSAGEWQTLCQPHPYRDYILVYQLHGESMTESCALALAERLNKKTVKISLDRFRRSKCDHVEYFPSVGRFLSLILNASCVVTDSFHGTAFSINFNRDFFVTMPDKTGERIESLLELTGLKDRIVRGRDEIVRGAEKSIDFSHCNEILENERRRALLYLKKAIE